MTFEGLAEHRDVATQLRASSVAEDRPPLVVDLQEVDLRVPLVLLQFVLRTNRRFSRVAPVNSCARRREAADLQEERQHLRSLPGRLLLGLSSPLLQQEPLLLRLRSPSAPLCFPRHGACSSSSSSSEAPEPTPLSRSSQVRCETDFNISIKITAD